MLNYLSVLPCSLKIDYVASLGRRTRGERDRIEFITSKFSCKIFITFNTIQKPPNEKLISLKQPQRDSCIWRTMDGKKY